jgi:hypothetical protein
MAADLLRCRRPTATSEQESNLRYRREGLDSRTDAGDAAALLCWHLPRDRRRPAAYRQTLEAAPPGVTSRTAAFDSLDARSDTSLTESRPPDAAREHLQ